MKKYIAILSSYWGWLAAVLVGLAVFYIGNIPYSDAQLAADEFNGDFAFHGYLHYPEDMDSYRVFTAQSARGQWLFSNPVMPDAQSGSYVNVVWLVAGKIQWLTGCSFGTIVTLLRFFGTMLLACGIFYFLRRILGRPLRAVVGTIGVFAVSGLGWVAMIPSELPNSLGEESPFLQFVYSSYFYIGSIFKALFVRQAGMRMPVPDTYTEVSAFFQSFLVPHAAIAVGLTLLVVALYADGFVLKSSRRRYAAAILLLVLQTIRPYEGFTVFGFLAVLESGYLISQVLKKRLALRTVKTFLAVLWQRCWPLLPSALMLVYYRWLMFHTPIWRAWGSGNTYPPPPGELFFLAFFWGLVGLSLLSLWLFAGGFRKKRVTTAKDCGKDPVIISRPLAAVLLGYATWHIILLYGLGLSIAWRTSAPLGVVAPMALMVAGYVIFDWLVQSLKLHRYASRAIAAVVLVSMLVLVVPSSIHAYIHAQDISKKFNRYYFIETVVNDAMDWAGKNLPAGSTVFTHGHYGLKIPAYGDLKVMLWHKDITPYFNAKKADYASFYNNDNRESRIRLLDAYDIDFIMQGPIDLKYAVNPDLDTADYLQKIFDNEFVKIYRVLPETFYPKDAE